MSRQYLMHLIKDAVTTMLQNRKRAFLTMLGIIIGVAAVIVIMAVGAGAQSLILQQVEAFGPTLIGALPGKSSDSGPPATVMGVVITTMTYDDVVAISQPKNVPHLVAAVGASRAQSTIAWRSSEYTTTLNGTGANYLEVEGGEVAKGRWFSLSEQENQGRVAVLGSTVKQELFGDNEAIGQTVKINKRAFEIIGVMKERGTVAFQDYDDFAFMPVTAVQKLIKGVNHIDLIRAKVDNEVNVEQALADMKITLRQQHGIDDPTGDSDDFTARSAAQALDMLKTITNGLRFFLAAMAALSLLIGGIGIMNIMLIRVAERTREIGLRKAVGANQQAIWSQFLVESTAITLAGGCLGLLLGIAVSAAIAAVAKYLNYTWPLTISWLAIGLALGVSGAIGLIFGLYPAKRAGKLDPVTALRYE